MADPHTMLFAYLSEMMQAFILRVQEPGEQWYYWMHNQTVQGARPHEVAHFEQVHADALADGSVRRIIGIPGEGQS
jgi:hypothetical protein